MLRLPLIMDTTHTCHLSPNEPHTVATCFLTATITPEGTRLDGVKCDGWPITVTITQLATVC